MSVFSDKPEAESTATTGQAVLRTHRREPGVLGELNSGAKRIAKSLANSADQSIQMIEHTITGAGFSAKTYRIESAEDYAITRHTASSNLKQLGYTPDEIAQLFGQL